MRPRLRLPAWCWVQVLDWCARHRLLRGSASNAGSNIGRHSSYPEWMSTVQARRARAKARTLFGDSLQASLK